MGLLNPGMGLRPGSSVTCEGNFVGQRRHNSRANAKASAVSTKGMSLRRSSGGQFLWQDWKDSTRVVWSAVISTKISPVAQLP